LSQGEADTIALVRSARAGDGDAFARLVQRHERMVLRTALRLLGRLDLAQDAAQEAFVRLFKYLGRFDDSRELGPWLHRITVNACHDLSRKRARLVALDEVTLDQARVGPEQVEEGAERAREIRLVEAALMTLGEKERAAVVLRDIEGRSTPEVARILGSSESTVRSQLSRARVKIKRHIETAQGCRG
jgi:RNA polymerase sigma-70 factor (ECF subfamily)